MHKHIVPLTLALFILLLTACRPQTASEALNSSLQPVTSTNLEIVTGQLVYVPAYSAIFYGSATETLELTVTLAIHNSDTDQPIIIRSVRLYDTEGNLVRDYVDEPAAIRPLGTAGFVVAPGEVNGGWGTNFLVEWVAEAPIYEPVIEAVMVSSRGTEGVSFLSTGRVVSETR